MKRVGSAKVNEQGGQRIKGQNRKINGGAKHENEGWEE